MEFFFGMCRLLFSTLDNAFITHRFILRTEYVFECYPGNFIVYRGSIGYDSTLSHPAVHPVRFSFRVIRAAPNNTGTNPPRCLIIDARLLGAGNGHRKVMCRFSQP